MARSIVVGLDGASWRLAGPWIDDGALPNLSRLREAGTWATSRSCLPPVTFPNWKCYSSGKNPGKLGVFWWERIDLERGQIDVMTGGDFDTAELWDYLNDAGLTTGVVNMPSMYPPRDIDGPVVAGGPDAVDGEYRSISSGYTAPNDLETYLIDEFDYRVHPDPLLASNRERGEEVEAILDLLDLRFRVALDLFERESLDFVHVTLFYLNVLHHFFWDDDPTKRAWTLIDDWLGRLADMDDTNLIVMSDHGSAPTDTEFYINKWLAANGYLSPRRTVEDYLQAVGLTRETVLGLAKQLGIVNVLSTVVPDRVQKLVPQEAGAKRERKLDKVVLEKTRAVASGQGPVYLNPTFRDEVLDALVEDLAGVTDDTGRPLFDAVERGEDVYVGPYVDIGPDVVIDQRPGVHVNDGMGSGPVLTAPDRWAAENTRSGLFVAAGPDFDPTGRIDEIDITDIAPTLLAALDVAVPNDMDGDVLPILLDAPATREKREPIHLGRDDPTRRHAVVADRLKRLGYME